jgi:triacylglycerol esterase/lipase EstA (alpha/beta hydrolase family)
MVLAVALSVYLLGSGGLWAYNNIAQRKPGTRNECVILLHGLGRTALSMTMVEHHLIQNGYAVVNIDYASTRHPISAIAHGAVTEAVSRCKRKGYDRIHFATHSLGAIVVRSYLQTHSLPAGSRVVMLAPPNQGSELADWAQQKFPKMIQLAGPAVSQLGTDGETLLARLKPIAPEVGIIIGTDSWNPFFSKILPGTDDGAVTIERARLKEMTDFMISPCNHTNILLDREVQQHIVRFLQNGRFEVTN